MEFVGYKLSFPAGIHIGNGTLEDNEKTFDAMHLFSALCIEAVRRDKDDLERLLEHAQRGEILFSDALPYIQNSLYIPKPMTRMELKEKGDSTEKKAFKSLEYIPIDSVGEYLTGKMDATKERMIFKNGFCRLEVRTLASISKEAETVPYRVGVCTFPEGSGLYLLVGYESEEILSFVKSLLESVSYSGIGGKKSSGFGRFSLREFAIPAPLERRLKNTDAERYMSLSVCLPKDDEMDRVMAGAQYRLKKRGGFVASSEYADAFLRKKDLFLFQAGSCFHKRFSGDIVDVSVGGKHPVYRYAKPLLMEV